VLCVYIMVQIYVITSRIVSLIKTASLVVEPERTRQSVASQSAMCERTVVGHPASPASLDLHRLPAQQNGDKSVRSLRCIAVYCMCADSVHLPLCAKDTFHFFM